MSKLNTIEIIMNNPFYNEVTVGENYTIRERNGVWYIDGRVYHRGKFERVNKSTNKTSTPSNKKWIEKNSELLLKKLSKTQKKIDEERMGVEKDSLIPKFGDYCMVSLKLKKQSIEIETYNDYIRVLGKYILPYFKDFRLDKIKTSDIEFWQLWVMDTFKITKGIKNIRSVLRIVLVSSKKNKFITENPMDDTDIPKFKNIEEENLSYTDEEMGLILTKCDEFIELSTSKHHTFSRNQLKNLIYLSYGSGMRSGEMISLLWSDIDFENKTIDINKTIRNGRVKTTKTESGIREIDMTEESYSSLLNQRELCKDIESEYVFLTQYKIPYVNSSEISKGGWKSYLQFCGIKYKRFYNLRHTFATKMLSIGFNIVSLSGHLGHKKVTTTMNRYVDNNFYKGKIGGKSILNDTFS